MTYGPLMGAFPSSSQNPLFPLDKFADYCDKRFRGMSKSRLAERLKHAAEKGVLRPIVVHGDQLFYSSFQLWQVQHLTLCEAWGVGAERVTEFEPILKLLIAVQDFYLPEARGNRRFGIWHDYGGIVAFGGFTMQRTLTCVISNVHRFRRRALAEGRLDPSAVLESSGVTTEELERWQLDLHLDATSLDPLDAWRDLVASIGYDKRLRLKYEALLAHDYYETVEVLRLFSVDAGLAKRAPEYTDPTDLSDRDEATGLPDWKVEQYGDTLWQPFAQLEFLANDYGLNPRPRGIILTEGYENEAVAELLRRDKFDPEFLGIELRSIHGVGNFTLANWQVFVEYMHEKQVLVFFLLDAEGDAPRQARRLLERKRLFPCEGLEKVIPAEDRIRVWPTSFEEVNFTDNEIANAMTALGVGIADTDVTEARTNRGAKGLIEYLLHRRTGNLAKSELCILLVKNLIAARAEDPAMPLRPIEEFIESAGKLILYNHQPTSIDLVKMNRQTGYLG